MRRRWPVLAWLAVAALSLWLYEHGGEYIRVNGMVEVVTESVAPLETGRIRRIFVVPGQEVEAGTVVAELDTRAIEEEIAVRREDLRAQQAGDERQFLTAEQRLGEELREHRLAQARDEAELGVYRRELERVRALIADGYATADESLELDLAIAGLESRLALYPQFLASLERERENLQAQREQVLARSAPGPSASSVPSRLQQLERRLEEQVLRAQRPGTVSRVRRQPGEVVDAGERVVDIITRQPPRILAFMNEADTRPIAVGDQVEIEAAVGGPRVPARVLAISPNVLALPDRASPLPDQVVRGRRLELEPLEALDLAPGASVVVMLPRKEMLWTSLFGGNGR